MSDEVRTALFVDFDQVYSGLYREWPAAAEQFAIRPEVWLRFLERGLHAVLLAMQRSLGCWSEAIHYWGADPEGHHTSACWPDGHDCSLPVDATTPQAVARFQLHAHTIATATIVGRCER